MTEPNSFRIATVDLDESAMVRRTREIEQERDIAIYDLLDNNTFAPAGSSGGPYRLLLCMEDSRLVFDIRPETDEAQNRISLSLTPFRRIIKDYFLVCDSYFKAIRNAPRAQIESLDMGRRGLHDEASHLLREKLEGKIAVDFETARRLFTLICVLHLRG